MPTVLQSTGNLLVETSFLPSWAFVKPLRTFVKDLLGTTCPDDEHVAHAVTTTHELVENAVKYGRGPVNVNIQLDTRGFVVSISVSNRASPERRTELIQRIRELTSAHPTSYYRTRMLDSVAKGGGGLGLARIRAECSMSLSWKEEAEELVVVAQPDQPTKARTAAEPPK